jgi:2-oxoglutarate ferredoxin oxidoreductase subunit delta
MSRIVIHENLCKGCGLCTIACPHKLVCISEHFNAKGYRPAAFADPDGTCTGCANCATMCPDFAIVVYRTRKVQPAPESQRASSPRRAGQPGRAP